MKILVVYFSRTGHTGRMAKEIARRCEADIEAIQELSRDDSWWAGWRARWQAMCRADVQIQRPSRNPARYDLVIIGAPVGKTGVAAPVRSYVRQYQERFRQVAFFCAEGGDADQRGFDELARLCARQPVATFAVDRKGLPPSAHREGLTDFMDGIGLQAGEPRP